MKYQKGLIPDQHRVLQGYFNETNIIKSNALKTIDVLGAIFFVIFLLLALLFVAHPLMLMFFGIPAFVCSPFGRRYLERRLRFRMTLAMLFGCIFLFGIPAIPMAMQYSKEDTIANLKAEAKRLAEQKMAAEIAAKDKNRRDSLALYLNEATKAGDNIKKARAMVALASGYTKTDSDKVAVKSKEIQIMAVEANAHFKSKRYAQAIKGYNAVVDAGLQNAEVLYKRGYSYYKIGKLKLAVADLEVARQLRYEGATRLYEKVNPIRKRIAYYVTRCCDGSTSDASGRGACSWHGGVCNWNEPIYEEYRKY